MARTPQTGGSEQERHPTAVTPPRLEVRRQAGVVEELGAKLPDFAFTPVLSDATPECAWDGPTGFVHEHLRHGLNVCRGEVTHPAVAKALEKSRQRCG